MKYGFVRLGRYIRTHLRYNIPKNLVVAFPAKNLSQISALVNLGLEGSDSSAVRSATHEPGNTMLSLDLGSLNARITAAIGISPVVGFIEHRKTSRKDRLPDEQPT